MSGSKLPFEKPTWTGSSMSQQPMSVSNLEDMAVQVLRFQNPKLEQSIKVKLRQEEELRVRVAQLEKRQEQDNAVIGVIDRYWNNLNQDLDKLLAFDSESSQESECQNENKTIGSFLAQLSTWDKNDVPEDLIHRIRVSCEAVANIIQAFDRLQRQRQRIALSLERQLGESGEQNSCARQRFVELERENRMIQDVSTKLHEKHHGLSLKLKVFQEHITAAETTEDELKNQVCALEWEVSKMTSKNENSRKLAEDYSEKCTEIKGSVQLLGPGFDLGGHDEENCTDDSPEELGNLADNRLVELQRLREKQEATLNELEKLHGELQSLPKSALEATPEFLCQYSKLSVAVNENYQLRDRIQEISKQIKQVQEGQAAALMQLELDDLQIQKELVEEKSDLLRTLTQASIELEALKEQLEAKTFVRNQEGRASQKMKLQLEELIKNNRMLKEEVNMYKRRYKQISTENEEMQDLITSGGHDPVKSEKMEKDQGHKNEEITGPGGPINGAAWLASVANNGAKRARKISDVDTMSVQDLQDLLDKTLEEKTELKLKLDVYKGLNKELRTTEQLVASGLKIREEIDEVKGTIENLKDDPQYADLADEDDLKRIKFLEEEVHYLQKIVTSTKQEEELLINEMEVSGQTFEEMQEQNLRLSQFLRGTDDMNLKLLGERIKSDQIQKCDREKYEALQEQLSDLSGQIEQQTQTIVGLQVKEDQLQSSLQSMEQEAGLAEKAMELQKRELLNNAQSCEDLNRKLGKYQEMINYTQQVVQFKDPTLEAQVLENKVLEEKKAALMSTYEHLNKCHVESNSNQVMSAEILEYKETLTCPSCKVKKKDTVIVKCFHVFCFDCLRTRYETRQRKCPKCNAPFGANDYRRLNL